MHEPNNRISNCKMKLKFSIFLMSVLIAGLIHLQAQPKTLVLNAGAPVAPIQSTMWGLFFEDINFAADGGIYAELVKKPFIRILQANDGLEKIWRRICRSIPNYQ